MAENTANNANQSETRGIAKEKVIMFAIKKKSQYLVLELLNNLKVKNDSDLEDKLAYAEGLGIRLNNGERQIEPLYDLVCEAIEVYEQNQYPIIENSDPVDILRFLMDQNGHERKDLYDIASKSIWSDIFNGKRQLNLNQIKALAKKYNVSVDTFITDL